MLGLVNYTSSDEEEAVEEAPVNTQHGKKASRPADSTERTKVVGKRLAAPEPQIATPPAAEPVPKDAPPTGPALGPSMPMEALDEPPEGNISAPQSPYTSTRLAVRNLTMPPVPNFDIPPSPPGSPPPASTERFSRFLKLKKQGVHFNEKLEKSSALKNPNLLQKLMDFAGFDEKDQYVSALPVDLAVPTSFPPWAYADQLNKTQQELTKKREEERARKQREAIDFVPATSDSARSSRGVTPVTSRAGPLSAAERVMAGLDREKSGSLLVQDVVKRRDGYDNSGKSGSRRSRFDRRSPPRKRSRSR